jgi:hypothetical protein
MFHAHEFQYQCVHNYSISIGKWKYEYSIATDQLGNRVVVRGNTFHSRLRKIGLIENNANVVI